MSRYPWRDTSEDISGQVQSQWETPGGAQEKADKALEEAKKYTDDKNLQFDDHIKNKVIHVTQEDKDRWNNKAPGSTKTELDSHVSNVDIHVTADKKAEWDSKAPGSTVADLAAHKADQVVHVTQSDHDKLNGIQEGAQVNQNAFAKVNDIQAADPSDAVTIKGGVGIKVTTNPNTKEVEVTATGDAAPGAHGPTHTEHGADPIPVATPTEGGIMSAAQAAELVAHDELLDEHAAAITALEDRLDTADTDAVTLQPGLQVIKAAKDARFRLGQVKGKSEINGQGRTGIIGVENPYVIGTSDNLLSPFYEWTIFSHASVVSPYVYKQVYTDGNWSYGEIEVAPNTDYYLSFKSPNGVKIGVFQAGDSGTVIAWHSSAPFSFNSGNNSRIRLVIAGDIAGVIENPMLVVGTERQPFQPQRKSMLAFQTELHANPTDASESDVLFEQGGEYRKLAKWKKVVLGDEERQWGGVHLAGVGYKAVVLPATTFGGNVLNHTGHITKYNGVVLPRAAGASLAELNGPDLHYLDFANLVLTVSNSDSGWGPDYTPTPEEIKAYFMGWVMTTQESWNTTFDQYNGTGTKGWLKRYVGVGNPVVTSTIGTFEGGSAAFNLPTSVINSVWTPYNLLYRLAKDTVEPVVSEGSLTLTEGDNLVEGGTGIVLRERSEIYGIYINAVNAGRRLKYKTTDIRAVYKNNMPDNNWTFHTNTHDGELYAYARNPDFDSTAVYTTTYIKLDKSPIQPITGTLAANEKTQISDLTADVAEALQRVSVVEMKKADEDAPGWITPTLLNGAVHGSAPVAYKKVNGMVVMRGIFTTTAGSILLFRLPAGYRPKDIARFMLMGVTSGQLVPVNVEVNTNGDVAIGYIGTDYMSLNGVIFEAEQ